MLEMRGEYRKAQELMEKHLPHEELRGGYTVEGLDLLACSRFPPGSFQMRSSTPNAVLGFTAHKVTPLSPAPSGRIPASIARYGWHSVCGFWSARPCTGPGQTRRVPGQRCCILLRSGSRLGTTSFCTSCAVKRRQPVLGHGAQSNLRLNRGSCIARQWGGFFHGWALAQQGGIQQGIDELKEGIAACRASGAELDRPYHLGLLTEAYLLARERRKATATLREAIEQVESTHSFFYEAELWRLQGTLRWTFVSDHAGAREYFERARHIAQAQQARSLELRSAISMARLLREQGAGHQSAELLASLYRSFVGVQETPDLRAARLELKALGKMTSGAKKLAA